MSKKLIKRGNRYMTKEGIEIEKSMLGCLTAIIMLPFTILWEIIKLPFQPKKKSRRRKY